MNRTIRRLLASGLLGLLVAPGAATQSRMLTPQEAREDLDQLQRELTERAAYVEFGEPDYRGAIDAARARAADGLSVYELGLEIDRVLALMIDCHSWAVYPIPGGFLPFRMETSRGRTVAFWPDRSGFVDPDYPFVCRIDGRMVDEWIEALSVVGPKGSPQFVRRRGLNRLTAIRFARDVVGAAHLDSVDVELESRAGTAHKTLSYPLAATIPPLGRWPPNGSQLLPENIGYLRITFWDEKAREEIAQWMPRFRSTSGLVIDLRDNGGGDRNVLRALYPYLVTRRDPPLVANVAQPRLYSGYGPDLQASRRMYPWTWTGWTFAERLAIARLMSGFVPEWEVPAGQFGEWHYWVLSKRIDPGAYDYRGRVVFLMNERCASAADVILSAVKGLPRVTLIGRPSAGASGAYVETTLRHSGIALALSAMASFQRDGRLYDSRGVEPDIRVEVEPEFFVDSGADTELTFAIETIRRLSRRLP